MRPGWSHFRKAHRGYPFPPGAGVQLRPQPQHTPASPPGPPTVRVPVTAAPFRLARASRLCVSSISMCAVSMLTFSVEPIRLTEQSWTGDPSKGSDTLGLIEGVLADKLSFRKGKDQAHIRGAVCGRWKSLLSASGCFPQRCGGAQRAPLARHTCPDKQNQASVLTAPQRAGQTILLEMWQPLDQLSPGKLVSPPRWAAIFGCCGRSKVCTLKSGVSYSVWHPWIS